MALGTLGTPLRAQSANTSRLLVSSCYVHQCARLKDKRAQTSFITLLPRSPNQRRTLQQMQSAFPCISPFDCDGIVHQSWFSQCPVDRFWRVTTEASGEQSVLQETVVAGFLTSHGFICVTLETYALYHVVMLWRCFGD